MALDIIPWILWGNTPSDTTSFDERFNLAKKGLLGKIVATLQKVDPASLVTGPYATLNGVAP